MMDFVIIEVPVKKQESTFTKIIAVLHLQDEQGVYRPFEMRAGSHPNCGSVDFTLTAEDGTEYRSFDDGLPGVLNLEPYQIQLKYRDGDFENPDLDIEDMFFEITIIQHEEVV